MKVPWTRSLLLYWAVVVAAALLGESRPTYQGTCCFAQEPSTKTANEDVARALDAIRHGDGGVGDGFFILGRVNFNGTCPDQLLALIHSRGDRREEIIWRLGGLIVKHKLTISGEQLVAEYDKAGKAGRLARQAVCAFAAYQTGRRPPETIFGEKLVLPKPTPLDKATLVLLARALTEDDPAVRVAAADSIRLAGIRDDRFLEPLLKGISDKNTVVSDAASLAAAELGFGRASPLILRRLEKHLEDPEGDGEGSLVACGLPLAPLDQMRLWGNYYSPRYGGGGWLPALGTLHYRPALPVLRKMAAPFKPAEQEAYRTGGENEAGWANDLAKAILDIDDRPHRPAALLQLAEDKTLAGDVRAAALRMLDECDSVCETRDPATGTLILTDLWRQYYESGILQKVVKLIDDQTPITNRSNEPGCLGRLAIEVAARKFCPTSHFYQAQLQLMGKPNIFDGDGLDEKPLPTDPVAVYPKNLLPVRQQLRDKLESLLPGRDGALALEALAVACPEWGTLEKYVGIATDPKRQPLVRVAAANLVTRQPLFLEMEGGGIGDGKNAPPETASRLLSLLEIQGEMERCGHGDAVVRVFCDLLGNLDSDPTNKQRAARKELLPRLRAMQNSPHADAALKVLLEVYGFSHAAKAWDANSGDPSDRPRQTDTIIAAEHVGPPVEVTARRSLGFRGGIQLITLAQNGKTLLVGDGNTLGDSSGSRVLLLDPRDLTEKAKTSIKEELPWSSHSAVPGLDGQRVLVFNRFVDLNTLKAVSVLDVQKAVTKGNVRPEPLAISPNGKLALVHVSSYIDSKLDALAIFDVASGNLDRIIEVGEEQPVCNGCFLDEKEIAVHGCRGGVLAVKLESGKQRDLCDNGPRAICTPGTNWHMAVLAKGRYLVVSGYKEFVVVETSQGKELFRKKVEGGNAVPILGGRFLLYQGANSTGLMPRTVFLCARVSDGKVMAEFDRERAYATLVPGEQDDVIYAVDHDSLSRLRFQWGRLLLNVESHPKEGAANQK